MRLKGRFIPDTVGLPWAAIPVQFYRMDKAKFTPLCFGDVGARCCLKNTACSTFFQHRQVQGNPLRPNTTFLYASSGFPLFVMMCTSFLQNVLIYYQKRYAALNCLFDQYIMEFSTLKRQYKGKLRARKALLWFSQSFVYIRYLWSM